MARRREDIAFVVWCASAHCQVIRYSQTYGWGTAVVGGIGHSGKKSSWLGNFGAIFKMISRMRFGKNSRGTGGRPHFDSGAPRSRR